jgi:hypothetical protein
MVAEVTFVLSTVRGGDGYNRQKVLRDKTFLSLTIGEAGKMTKKQLT